jgi:hypothetical protein
MLSVCKRPTFVQKWEFGAVRGLSSQFAQRTAVTNSAEPAIGPITRP